jgi:hypothetical protein
MDREKYLYCRYNIDTLGPVLNHHVLIKYEDGVESLITGAFFKGCNYKLISSRECFFNEKDLALDPIYKSLVFDGESLLSKLKRNVKTNSIKPKNESN